MFTETESKSVYERLIRILENSKIAWIIPQIQEEINRGEIIIKSIKDVQLKENLKSEFSIDNISKDKVSISQAYSQSERLQILIKAIEEVLIINDIKKTIFSNFKDIKLEVQNIEFLDDDNEAVPIETIGNEQIQSEKTLIDKLQELLTTLKKEI